MYLCVIIRLNIKFPKLDPSSPREEGKFGSAGQAGMVGIGEPWTDLDMAVSTAATTSLVEPCWAVLLLLAECSIVR